jgi:hypothetical protein
LTTEHIAFKISLAPFQRLSIIDSSKNQRLKRNTYEKTNGFNSATSFRSQRIFILRLFEELGNGQYRGKHSRRGYPDLIAFGAQPGAHFIAGHQKRMVGSHQSERDHRESNYLTNRLEQTSTRRMASLERGRTG